MDVIKSLEAELNGRLVLPSQEGYDDAREIWNSRVSKRPGSLVQCETSSDVAAAVNTARRNHLVLSVKGGGHSFGGLGVCEDGIALDLSPMNKIEIDAHSKRATVGAGTKWGELYEAAFRHGLGASGGTVTTVGVAGFTLGGGNGWLSRKHGLGLDNLLSVEIVTADGKIQRASESENSDLFWGVRGGAGNFGVVTRFEFQLHEVPEKVYAGQLLYPLSAAKDVFRLYRREIPNTSNGFVCYPCAFRIPPLPAFPEKLHGQVVAALVAGYIGDIGEGKSILERFKMKEKLLLEAAGPTPYMDLMKSFDPGMPYGQRWYSRSHYLDKLSDGAIDTFLAQVEDLPGPFTLAYFGADDGAVGQVETDATAFPHRDNPIFFHVISGWPDPAQDEEIMGWTKSFHEAMATYSNGGVYVNLLAEDEPDRIREAYGSNYKRLVELKRKWDPENLFRCNQNIPPE